MMYGVDGREMEERKRLRLVWYRWLYCYFTTLLSLRYFIEIIIINDVDVQEERGREGESWRVGE